MIYLFCGLVYPQPHEDRMSKNSPLCDFCKLNIANKLRLNPRDLSVYCNFIFEWGNRTPQGLKLSENIFQNLVRESGASVSDVSELSLLLYG